MSWKKFNWINFKDLIGFVQQFMNWAGFNLADRRVPKSGTKWNTFIGRREKEQGSYTRQKKWIGYCKVTLGQQGSIRQIT